MLPRKKQKNSLHTGIWYRVFLGCTFVICLTIGCKETQTSTEKTAVIRQKIVAQKETNEQPADGARDLKDSGKDKGEGAKRPAKPLTTSEKIHQKEPESQSGNLETVKKKTTPPVSQDSQRATSKSILEVEQKITESVTKKEAKAHESSVYSYNPIGKIDPFRPILSSKGGRRPDSSKKTLDKKVPLTPLQKIEIDQVKLVGIIVSSQENKAIVEDASGKGYILSKGTYIGTNFGKVVKILEDKVVVHEEVEDYITGQITSREVTLEPPQKYENGSMQ